MKISMLLAAITLLSALPQLSLAQEEKTEPETVQSEPATESPAPKATERTIETERTTKTERVTPAEPVQPVQPVQPVEPAPVAPVGPPALPVTTVTVNMNIKWYELDGEPEDDAAGAEVIITAAGNDLAGESFFQINYPAPTGISSWFFGPSSDTMKFRRGAQIEPGIFEFDLLDGGDVSPGLMQLHNDELRMVWRKSSDEPGRLFRPTEIKADGEDMYYMVLVRPPLPTPAAANVAAK